MEWAGESTLNAHCARSIRTINSMVVSTIRPYFAGVHRFYDLKYASASDAYAESYHENFANLERGLPAGSCGGKLMILPRLVV